MCTEVYINVQKCTDSIKCVDLYDAVGKHLRMDLNEFRNFNLTTPKMAHLLGIHIQTAYRWRDIGYGPTAIKIGNHWRYNQTDVMAWINRTSAEANEALRLKGKK